MLGTTVVAYGFSKCMMCPMWCSPSQGLAEASIKRPADIVYAADSCGVNAGAGGMVCGWQMAWANAMPVGGACSVRCDTTTQVDGNTRHNGGSSAVFIDGHAKWFNAQTTGNAQWDLDHIQNYNL